MKIKTMANNQFMVSTREGKYFQSYDSVVARIDQETNKVTLGSDYRYSRTTMKYLIQFLGLDSIKEVDKAIQDGRFIVDEDLKIT